MLAVGDPAEVDLSVICPFYNEGQILREAVERLLARLDGLDCTWELLVVDDGSTDGSGELAFELARSDDRLRVLSYAFNRGRGHALRTGIAQARGAVIVTTEIDLSWGEDIVERLVEAMQQDPDSDIVIASPHLPGGGYRNVPAKRVFLSRFGNRVIRACMSNAATMNTGMTRAYRRDVIRSLPLDEDRKEFHLEVVLKAQALGYRIREIPAVLEWREYKHEGRRVARKSSSKVKQLMVTHSLFALFANPIRQAWGLSLVSLLFSTAFLVAGIVRFAMGLVSVYMAIVSLAFGILALLFFSFGLIAQQGNMIQRELWRLKRDIESRSADGPPVPSRDARSRQPRTQASDSTALHESR